MGRAVLDLIDDMCINRGMGMLLVTHDMGVVASVADRVAVVYAGSIVEDGPVVDVYHRPLHPYTSGLLGSLPSLTRDRLRPIEGETHLPPIDRIGNGRSKAAVLLWIPTEALPQPESQEQKRLI